MAAAYECRVIVAGTRMVDEMQHTKIQIAHCEIGWIEHSGLKQMAVSLTEVLIDFPFPFESTNCFSFLGHQYD